MHKVLSAEHEYLKLQDKNNFQIYLQTRLELSLNMHYTTMYIFKIYSLSGGKKTKLILKLKMN